MIILHVYAIWVQIYNFFFTYASARELYLQKSDFFQKNTKIFLYVISFHYFCGENGLECASGYIYSSFGLLFAHVAK